MKIGSHVGNNGTLMLEGSIKEALSYDANCFMVYLGPPQNTIRKPLTSMNAINMAKIAEEHNINLEDIKGPLCKEIVDIAFKVFDEYEEEYEVE